MPMDSGRDTTAGFAPDPDVFDSADEREAGRGDHFEAVVSGDVTEKALRASEARHRQALRHMEAALVKTRALDRSPPRRSPARAWELCCRT